MRLWKVGMLMGMLCMLAICLSMTSRYAPYKMRLSAYGLFTGDQGRQIPASQVMPYELNSPLFSDYAHKLRFVRLPEGTAVEYNPDSVLQFPVGTVIAKTFYFFHDERDHSKGRRLLETRILLHEEGGWKSLPYVWNEEQTDALLDVAGNASMVNYTDRNGTRRSFEYMVPNMNQCKSCHEKNGAMTPIGPSVRQLNGTMDYHDGKQNQLKHWSEAMVLKGLPASEQDIPVMVDYADERQPLEFRARAYLDINCAHCHNRGGPAQTSGLFLDWKTKDMSALGVHKTPIAAGRGSGNLSYDIAPGKPAESILWYRMASSDPGVMMPEFGRKLKHEEGIKLIGEWIRSMKSE